MDGKGAGEYAVVAQPCRLFLEEERPFRAAKMTLLNSVILSESAGAARLRASRRIRESFALKCRLREFSPNPSPPPSRATSLREGSAPLLPANREAFSAALCRLNSVGRGSYSQP